MPHPNRNVCEYLHAHTRRVHTCTRADTHVHVYSGTSPLQNIILPPQDYPAGVWVSWSFSLPSQPDAHRSCVFGGLFPPVTQTSEVLGRGPGWCPLLLLLTLSWQGSLASSSSSLLLGNKVTQQSTAEKEPDSEPAVSTQERAQTSWNLSLVSSNST